ncbi:hypothetical protein C6P45_000385 [Maudiozyma exigua]|uniref:Uncharacterized protein n=1 Tax=Maudiozyma exigua TaxID=34358 RepID=A0A9P7BCS9_MAUEX|nr:hypothetical protein C6P45_000385 [Kazachstania exigua]
MTTDKQKRPEKLKLTTPRRNVKKYVSPLNRRKSSMHSSIGNGKLATTRKYRISKLPISNIRHRQLPKDNQIDNVHQDTVKTLEWMSSLINRAKSVLEKLKEEDLELQEELYQDSRRKELKKMHVQSILDKSYEDRVERNSTVSSTISDTAELSEEDGEQIEASIEQDQASENEEDEALVILTDSEVEESGSKEEQEDDDEDQEEHDEDMFDQVSEYEDENEKDNLIPVEVADQLLSSDSEAFYVQDIDQQENADENVDSVLESGGNEIIEENEGSDKNINMESEQDSYISEDNDNTGCIVEHAENSEDHGSDKEVAYENKYPLNATLMVPGTEAVHQISENNNHLLSSDLQMLAKQALFGNGSLTDNAEFNIAANDNVAIGNSEGETNPLSYESHVIDTNSMHYANGNNDDNESEEGFDEHSQKSLDENEYAGEDFDSGENESKIQDSPEQIAIEVESGSEMDESMSSGAYSDGYDVSDTNDAICNDNQEREEPKFALGPQSIADMLATIPHNVANHFTGSGIDVEPTENTEINIEEPGNEEAAHIDSLPQYADKVYDIKHHLIPPEHSNKVSQEVSTIQNFNTYEDVATEPKDEAIDENLVSSMPPDKVVAIEVNEIDTSNESEEEVEVPQEEALPDAQVLEEAQNLQSSFMHENTSVYFSVDEGTESLLDDGFKDVSENLLVDENDKYKIEISESVYASSQDGHSATSQQQKNTYTSPFGSDPFSANDNVEDVKALIKKTILSLSNPKEPHSSSTNDFELTSVQQSKSDTNDKGNEVITTIQKDDNNGSTQQKLEEHPLNDVFSNAATIGESEIENLIPEENDNIPIPNAALTGENLNMIPGNGMLNLLANIAENEDISNIDIPVFSHEIINDQPQEIVEADSRHSLIRGSLINDMSSSEQRNEEQLGNLVENISNGEEDSDIGMVTALQEVEEPDSIADRENITESETEADALDQPRLNSPAFHILGNGHHNHLVQDAHDYPTPVESAASSSNPSEQELAETSEPSEGNENNAIDETNTVDEVNSIDHFEANAVDDVHDVDKEDVEEEDISNYSTDGNTNYQTTQGDIRTSDDNDADHQPIKSRKSVELEEEHVQNGIEVNPPILITSREPRLEIPEDVVALNNKEIILKQNETETNDVSILEEEAIKDPHSDNETMSKEISQSSAGENSDTEMLDSSDDEKHNTPRTKTIMKKILNAPVNTFKYIVHNVQNITNVTENFVDVLNAYPAENEQSMMASGSHISSVVSNSGNEETDRSILYSSSTHRDKYAAHETSGEDIPMLDDTISNFREEIFKIDESDYSHMNDASQTLLQRSSQNDKETLSHGNGNETVEIQSSGDRETNVSEYVHGNVDVKLSSNISSASDGEIEIQQERNVESYPVPHSEGEDADNETEEEKHLTPSLSDVGSDKSVQPLEFEKPINRESNERLEDHITGEPIVNVAEISHHLESSLTAENSPSGNTVAIGIVEHEMSDGETANENTANENLNDDINLQTTEGVNQENTNSAEGSTEHVSSLSEHFNSEHEDTRETIPVFQDMEVNMQDIASQAIANIITQMSGEPEVEPASNLELSTVPTVPSDDSEYYTTGDADEILGVNKPREKLDVIIKDYNILNGDKDEASDNKIIENVTEEVALVPYEENNINSNGTQSREDDASLANTPLLEKTDEEKISDHRSLDSSIAFQDEDTREPSSITTEIVNIENSQSKTEEEPENEEIENESSPAELKVNEVENDNDVLQVATAENSDEKESSGSLEQVGENGNSDAETSKVIQIGVLPESSHDTDDQVGSEIDVGISESKQKLNDTEIELQNEEIEQKTAQSEDKEEIKDSSINDASIAHEVHVSNSDLRNDIGAEEYRNAQSPKKKNRKRTRNLRKRKRAITDDSSSDGPSKRTRRGALQKKNNFDRRGKRKTRK